MTNEANPRKGLTFQGMTIDQAKAAWEHGDRIIVAEFRTLNCERRGWTDKKTGAARSANVTTFTLEGERDGYLCSQFSEPDVDPEALRKEIQGSFKKGELVIFRLQGLMQEGGVWKARGELIKINHSANKPL